MFRSNEKKNCRSWVKLSSSEVMFRMYALLQRGSVILPSHPDKHSMMCSVTSSNFFFFQNSALPIENLNGKRLHILPERVRKRLDAIAVNGICGKKKKKTNQPPTQTPAGRTQSFIKVSSHLLRSSFLTCLQQSTDGWTVRSTTIIFW